MYDGTVSELVLDIDDILEVKCFGGHLLIIFILVKSRVQVHYQYNSKKINKLR